MGYSLFVWNNVFIGICDLASKEDKAQHIDRWAALSKAKTREILKMIAEIESLKNQH